MRDRREDLAHLGLMLCGLAAVLQASGFDSVAFDPFSFQQDGLTTPEVDISRRQVTDALHAKGIEPCIPSKSNRTVSIPCDVSLYRQRSKIEIMFGRLKDWRRIAMRYDRCAHTFFSAICLAATVIFWL